MPILRQNIILFIKLTKVLEVVNFRFLANFRFLTLCSFVIPELQDETNQGLRKSVVDLLISIM